MKNQELITETHLSGNKSILNISLQNFDLPALVENVKDSRNWKQGEMNTMVLLKSTDKKVVLTALPEDTEIESFQENDSITVQIIEGRLRFHTRKVTVLLGRGQFLTLHQNIKYSMTTSKVKTIFLLTIAGGKMLAGVN
jgi:ethanolamine utilization protein EutQ (cupin superfamily)